MAARPSPAPAPGSRACARPDAAGRAGAAPSPVARPRSIGRRLRYPIEGLAARIAFAIFRALPPAAASAAGAAIGALLGMAGTVLPLDRRARANLARALPELTDGEARRTLRAMWRHLGRVAGEYPHLGALDAEGPGARIEIVGAKHLEEARGRPGPAIFFTGHLGNWELAPRALIAHGIDAAVIYRAANNPIADALLWRARRALSETLLPKGPLGARGIVRVMRDGGAIILAADQRMTDGIPVPFFGRDAMTAPALAELAIKYGGAVYPIRVERLRGARFRITALAPLAMPDAGTQRDRVAALMRAVNATLEAWIRDTPAQWTWMHRRWPD